MKQNKLQKIILSLVLVATTFLTATINPIVRIYGELMEVSATADASSSFNTTDWVAQVDEAVADDEIAETLPEITPELEVSPTPVPEVSPIPEVSPAPEVSPIPEVSPPPEISPLPEVSPAPTPEINPFPEVSSIPNPEVSPTSHLELIDDKAQEDLPANSTIVNDYDELTAALAEDNGYEIIYLGANIYAERNGITIHPSKHNVIIDGYTPGAGMVKRTFLEYHDSISDPAKTIHLSSENTTTKNITLQNTTVISQHEAGIIFVPDDLSGVTVSYQNVDYKGPQIVTNPSGKVQFIDCNFMMNFSQTTHPHYVATANHIELGGAIYITTVDPSTQVIDAVFFPTNDAPQIDILRDAYILVDVQDYFLNVHNDTVNININQNATFDITSKIGFTPLDKNIKNMLIAEGAYVSIIQNNPQASGALRIEQTLEMLPDSDLSIICSSTSGSPIVFPTNEGLAIFDKPERVILFSPSLSSIDFKNNGYIKIITSSINAWSMNMVPFQDPPHIWNNSHNKMLSVEAVYEDGLPISFIHSLEDDSPSTGPLTVDEFDLTQIKLLTFGRIDLSVDPIYTDSTAITGLTEGTAPNFKVTVTADYDGLLKPLKPVEANPDGIFSFELDPETLNHLNPVTVTSSFNSLSKREIIFPQEPPSGALAFSVAPATISFRGSTITNTPTMISRTSGNFAFSVSDTRNYPKPWRVDASISTPLTATLDDGSKVTLPNALVFVDSHGESIPLSNSALPIYYEDSSVAGNSDVIWDTNEGILLNVAPGNIYSNATYSTTICWNLVDAP